MIQLAKNLWRYRELVASLVRRELSARYKQSLLGPAWALLQPLLLMLTFTVVQSFVNLPSDGLPYPIFAYAALLPWTMFTNTVALATPSIVLNSSIVKKIYFPREVFPISAALVALFDFAMAFVVLIGLMLYYGIAPTVWIALLPAMVLIQLAFALGISFAACAVGTFKRDIIFAAFFILQIWMYASPVIYPLSAVPEGWRTLYLANPMAGIIASFRQILVGGGAPDTLALASGSAGALVALLLGYALFKALERYYADVV
jgi:lipopolysaccharide transport system permease protein